MPLPRAGSWAGLSSRWQPAPAVSGSPARCRRPADRLVVMHDLIHVSEEVQTALEEERAVVALETTLVAHGFPAPDGVETGLAREARCPRARGGTGTER